jgi:hypothetical protein
VREFPLLPSLPDRIVAAGHRRTEDTHYVVANMALWRQARNRVVYGLEEAPKQAMRLLRIPLSSQGRVARQISK